MNCVYEFLDQLSHNARDTPGVTCCRTLVFGGCLILSILEVKAKSAKILFRQYYMQSLSETQIKGEPGEYLRYFRYYP